MPIKIFAAPGDQRNDFEPIEMQANEWMAQSQPQIVSMHTTVNQMPGPARDSGGFMMTLVVHYNAAGS